MQVEQYYSDDYAGLISGKYKFYYGYESFDEEEHEEWYFYVTINGNVVFKQSTSQIEQNLDSTDQLNEPTDYLVAGIGMWLLFK